MKPGHGCGLLAILFCAACTSNAPSHDAVPRDDADTRSASGFDAARSDSPESGHHDDIDAAPSSTPEADVGSILMQDDSSDDSTATALAESPDARSVGPTDAAEVEAEAGRSASIDAQVVDGAVLATLVSVGGGAACATGPSGVLKCWGSDTYGELGGPASGIALVPQAVTGVTGRVTSISVGKYLTCAAVAGVAQCWGVKTWSGDAATSTCVGTPCSYAPVPIAGLSNDVVAVAVGTGIDFVCALSAAGGLQCWGDDLFGELGNGSVTTSLTPVQVSGLTSGVTSVSAGEGFACAVVAGAAQCWGDNLYGKLGDGNSTYNSTRPAQVVGLTTGVTSVSAGGASACALTDAGSVQCWGQNMYGQLGNGSRSNSAVPVQVTGLTSGVTAISVGTTSACAVTAGGGVVCWGQNSIGQLGTGSKIDSAVPVAVSGLSSGATSVSVGLSTACAALAGGSLECWGNYESLGSGMTVSSSVPVAVNGL